jgi:hypothetical protein
VVFTHALPLHPTSPAAHDVHDPEMQTCPPVHDVALHTQFPMLSQSGAAPMQCEQLPPQWVASLVTHAPPQNTCPGAQLVQLPALQFCVGVHIAQLGPQWALSTAWQTPEHITSPAGHTH